VFRDTTVTQYIAPVIDQVVSFIGVTRMVELDLAAKRTNSSSNAV
jgi:hypothetical protein